MEKPVAVIYVDLDETLLRIDLLKEKLLLLALRAPWALFPVLGALVRGGRVGLKTELARRYRLDAAHLPYHEGLLDWLRQRRREGLPIVLATSAARAWAEAVAQHMGLFDRVLATETGSANLKGGAKLRAILQDAQGAAFAYAGDARCDRPIFEAATLPIVVGAGPARAGANAARALCFARTGGSGQPGWRALRLHQWSKNILIFAPVIAAHRIDGTWGSASLGFFAFGGAASALYILNDLCDVDLDRHHFQKRHRAFAAGTLSPARAVLLGAACLLFSILLASYLPRPFLYFLALYAGINWLYSHGLKNVAVADVVTLAFLYSLRIFAGGAACGIVISNWLLALTFFLALSLAHLKRYLELGQRTRDGLEAAARPAYLAADAPLLAFVGAASGLTSVLVSVLYIASPQIAQEYHFPQVLFLLCLLQFYWIERMWLLAFRGQMTSDPIDFMIRDRAFYIVSVLAFGVTWIAAFAFA